MGTPTTLRQRVDHYADELANDPALFGGILDSLLEKKATGETPAEVLKIASGIEKDLGLEKSAALKMAWQTYVKYVNPGHPLPANFAEIGKEAKGKPPAFIQKMKEMKAKAHGKDGKKAEIKKEAFGEREYKPSRPSILTEAANDAQNRRAPKGERVMRALGNVAEGFKSVKMSSAIKSPEAKAFAEKLSGMLGGALKATGSFLVAHPKTTEALTAATIGGVGGGMMDKDHPVRGALVGAAAGAGASVAGGAIANRMSRGAGAAARGASAVPSTLPPVLNMKSAEAKAFVEKLGAKLTPEARKNLSKGEFAEPGEKKYPIEDKAHARNALARVSQHGSAAEKTKVRAAVHAKYPDIGEEKKSQVKTAAGKQLLEGLGLLKG